MQSECVSQTVEQLHNWRWRPNHFICPGTFDAMTNAIMWLLSENISIPKGYRLLSNLAYVTCHIYFSVVHLVLLGVKAIGRAESAEHLWNWNFYFLRYIFFRWHRMKERKIKQFPNEFICYSLHYYVETPTVFFTFAK